MIKNTFKIDLGQGDSLDVHTKNESDIGVHEFVNSLEEKNDWIFFNTTVINKRYIKRIEKIK